MPLQLEETKWQLRESVEGKIQCTQELETLKESYREKKNPQCFMVKMAQGECVEQRAKWKGSSGRTRKGVSVAGRISFQR